MQTWNPDTLQTHPQLLHFDVAVAVFAAAQRTERSFAFLRGLPEEDFRLETPLPALELPLSLPESLPEELSELLVPFAELELPDDIVPLDEWEVVLLRIFEWN